MFECGSCGTSHEQYTMAKQKWGHRFARVNFATAPQQFSRARFSESSKILDELIDAKIPDKASAYFLKSDYRGEWTSFNSHRFDFNRTPPPVIPEPKTERELRAEARAKGSFETVVELNAALRSETTPDKMAAIQPQLNQIERTAEEKIQSIPIFNAKGSKEEMVAQFNELFRIAGENNVQDIPFSIRFPAGAVLSQAEIDNKIDQFDKIKARITSQIKDNAAVDKAKVWQHLTDSIDNNSHLLFNRDRQGLTPYHIATQLTADKNHDLLRSMIKHVNIAEGFHLSVADAQGRTCLHAACLSGDPEAVHILLHCSEVTLQDNAGKTPVQLVLESNMNPENKRKILQMFDDVRTQKFIMDPKMSFAEYQEAMKDSRKELTLEELTANLTRKPAARVEAASPKGAVSRLKAFVFGKEKVSKEEEAPVFENPEELLSKGVVSPLHQNAAPSDAGGEEGEEGEEGELDVNPAELLKNAPINPTFKTVDIKPREFPASFADVNSLNTFIGALRPNEKITAELKELIKGHSNLLREKDGNGHTPFQQAILQQNRELVEFLCTDPDLDTALYVYKKDNSNKTPVELAQQTGNKDIENFLTANLDPESLARGVEVL